MDENNYFDVIIKLYEMTGLRKNTKSLTRFISLYVVCPLTLMMYFLVIYNLTLQSGNMLGLAQACESISSFGQHFLRKITLILFASEFDEVINSRAKFWKMDSFDKSFVASLYKKIRFSIYQIYLLWTGGTAVLIIIIIMPIFFDNINLPVDCWMPFDNKLFYIFIFFFETFMSCELIFMTASTDAIFLFMCTDLEVQLQLLGKTVKDIDIGASDSAEYEEACLRKLKECSSHHRFLLKVHQKLGTMFSIYFILQFLINIIGNTVEFYLISNYSSDPVIFSKCISYITAVVVQGSISFVPASSVEIEAENLSNDIYGVDWYNSPSMKIKKFILFWLMKAQEPLEMSGGGMMRINRNVFLEIPRTAFSIYTLLN